MADQPIAAGKSSYDLVDPAKLFTALDLPAGSVLLDAACGIGNYALAAARHIGKEGRIIAVDLWPEGIAALKKSAEEQGIKNIEAEVADLKDLPLKNDDVDICLLATVLHDLVEEGSEAAVLREIARVIRPGGSLKIIEFEKIEGPPGPPEKIRLDAGAVEKTVTPFGFRSEQQAASIGPFNYLIGFVRE